MLTETVELDARAPEGLLEALSLAVHIGNGVDLGGRKAAGHDMDGPKDNPAGDGSP